MDNDEFDEDISTNGEKKESHWAAVYRMNKPVMGMALGVAGLLALAFILGSLFT